MLAKLYRKIVPGKIRKIIYNTFLDRLLILIRNFEGIMRWYWCKLFYAIVSPKNEREQAYKAWGIAGNSPYPYIWKKEYDLQHYEVNVDHASNLPYVVHNGKKLYFKRDMVASVESGYRGLMIEQDKRSAHRYVDFYDELKGKTLLDIGAAEAIFTLDAIEYVNHAYLFECEEAWIEALEATFAPWRNKITIVRKYVSDVDDDNNITLDTFFQGERKSIDNLFLKMDIEGYERKALKGAAHILSHGKPVSGSVCIYHLPDDPEVIENLLHEYGLQTIIQTGYLYMCWEMRPGVIKFKS